MTATYDLGEKRVPRSRQIVWGVGSLGTGLILNVQTIFYSNYLVDYVGISAALVGTLLLVAKLFDLATDLPMGWLSDRTRTPLGRRRPYLLIGAVMAALAFIALFNVPQSATAGYALASLLFLSLAYTIYAVPYIAIPSEMTDSSHERSRIMSWRVVFALIATTFGATLTGFLIDAFGGGSDGFAGMSLVLGAVIGVSCLIAFFGAPSQPDPVDRQQQQAVPMRQRIALLLDNKPFLLLLTVKILQLLAFACNIGIQIFFFVQVVGVSFSTYGMLAMWKGLATICSVGLWTALSRRISKRVTYMICATGWGLTTLTWLLAGPGEPLWATAARFVFIGLFASGQILMGLSILTDTIEYDRRRTGLRREGLYSGIYTSAEKFAFAAAPAVSGVYLTMAGYEPGLGAFAGQPASAITAIYVLLAVVPAVLNAVSVGVLYFLNLDDERIKAGAAAG